MEDKAKQKETRQHQSPHHVLRQNLHFTRAHTYHTHENTGTHTCADMH